MQPTKREPVQVMFEEHAVITSALDVAREAGRLVGSDDERYAEIVRRLLGFFRDYADGYHHQKEELLLFNELAKRDESLARGPVAEMLENHADFRGQLAGIERELGAGRIEQARQGLEDYAGALLDHIAVENDEILPAVADLLDGNELERLYFRFVDRDRELGDGRKRELEGLVGSLRASLEAQR